MQRKLIVKVMRVRSEGKILPSFRLRLNHCPTGVLTIREEWVPSLSRHLEVARLRDRTTDQEVEGIGPLYDAKLLRFEADRVIVTGWERVQQLLGEIDVAQTWIGHVAELETKPDWSPGNSVG